MSGDWRIDDLTAALVAFALSQSSLTPEAARGETDVSGFVRCLRDMAEEAYALGDRRVLLEAADALLTSQDRVAEAERKSRGSGMWLKLRRKAN